MTSSSFGVPTQYEVQEMKIGDEDVVGLFVSLSIYENIYTPCITGALTICDSEGAGFIDEKRIEFIEPITVAFKDADGTTLEFKGFLNGLRNEYIKDSLRYYAIDFNSESVRKNEETYIVKSFKDAKPKDIVEEMVEKLGGQLSEGQGQGLPMTYLASRRRPVDVIKYVLTHGLSQKTEATEQGDNPEEEAKGTTGYLLWETLDGFRFETIDEVNAGSVGTKHTNFKRRLNNRNLSMEDAKKSIMGVEFRQLGDFQTKLRSGAFASKVISHDMDTGDYKEYYYYNRDNMTEKQKEALPEGRITRYLSKPYSNQKFQAAQSCEPSKPSTGDQSRKYLAQNEGRQNTFSDQTGEFTLYPQFKMRAGDVFECKLSKVKDEAGENADGGYDKKHSGRYIINQVAHHFFVDGKAYTVIKTNRSTIQQDDSSSTKS